MTRSDEPGGPGQPDTEKMAGTLSEYRGDRPDEALGLLFGDESLDGPGKSSAVDSPGRRPRGTGQRSLAEAEGERDALFRGGGGGEDILQISEGGLARFSRFFEEKGQVILRESFFLYVHASVLAVEVERAKGRPVTGGRSDSRDVRQKDVFGDSEIAAESDIPIFPPRIAVLSLR